MNCRFGQKNRVRFAGSFGEKKILKFARYENWCCKFVKKGNTAGSEKNQLR